MDPKATFRIYLDGVLAEEGTQGIMTTRLYGLYYFIQAGLPRLFLPKRHNPSVLHFIERTAYTPSSQTKGSRRINAIGFSPELEMFARSSQEDRPIRLERAKNQRSLDVLKAV